MHLRALFFPLCLFLIVGVAHAAFPDVPSNHPYREAIEWLQSEGAVGGNPDGTFLPESTINRAEFAKIIVHHALGHPARDFDAACFGLTEEENFQGKKGTFIFPDVQENEWFSVPVCAAYTLNLVHGYPDGTFGPARTINFAEAAKIVARLHSSQPLVTGTPWYQSSIDYLEKKNAVPASVTGPDHLLTRGEMAEILKMLSLDGWVTYENDTIGFTIDYPSEWQAHDRGQGGAGFFPATETGTGGDEPFSAGVEISNLLGEEYGASLGKSLSTVLQEIKESENGNCDEPVPSLVGSAEATYMRCTAVWDGSIVEHYLLEVRPMIWDVTVRGSDSALSTTLEGILDSFALLE